jgi:hypothetical protein
MVWSGNPLRRPACVGTARRACHSPQVRPGALLRDGEGLQAPVLMATNRPRSPPGRPFRTSGTGRGILRGVPAHDYKEQISCVPIAALRSQERSETPSIPAILAQWAQQ